MNAQSADIGTEPDLENNLNQVIEDLVTVEAEYNEAVRQETEIQKQIERLRAQLTPIRERKFTKAREKKDKERLKDSYVRQIAIKAERTKLEDKMQELLAEADRILANAPFIEKLLDWQKEGAVKLANAGRGILSDTRGMGKSLTAIVYRRLVQSKKTLILTKKSLVPEFGREIHKWEAGAVSVIPVVGASSEHRKMALEMGSLSDNLIIIGNYEMWRRNKEAIEDFVKFGFDTVIVDEAHNLKNLQGVTTKRFMSIADSVKNVLFMTGTPIQNRPQELFSLLHMIYPKLFPNRSSFELDYCTQIDQNRWKFTHDGLDRLFKKIGHFMVGRTPTDVGHKIPPPNIIRYDLDFSGYTRQEEAYRIITERNLALLKSGEVLPITSQLALMTRQAQMISWPAGIKFRDPTTGEVFPFDVHESVKLDWAEDLINDLFDEERRVVLFSRFVPAVYELEKRLVKKGIRTAVITGERSQYTASIVKDFDIDAVRGRTPNYDVLLATIGTVSEGANLNAASDVIPLDRVFKPATEDQIIGRVDRLNSVRQATAHIPHLGNSIDDFLEKLIEFKRGMVGDYKTAHDMQQGLIDNLEKSLKR